MSDEVQNQNNHQNLIAEIENKIQFLVMIAIFFPAVMYYFFNIYDRSNADKVALSYVGIVAAYLVNYIFFETFKSKIKTNILKKINFLALIGISTFLLPVIYLSLIVTQPSVLLFMMQILFKISLCGLMIVPILLFIMILWPLVFCGKITFWRR